MKTLGLSGVVGLLVGSGIIYWLELDEPGGIGLVLLICMSLTVGIGNFISKAKDNES